MFNNVLEFIPIYIFLNQSQGCPVVKDPEIAAVAYTTSQRQLGLSSTVFARRSQTDEVISGYPVVKNSEIAAVATQPRKDNKYYLRLPTCF